MFAWHDRYDRHAAGYARELDPTFGGSVKRMVELAAARREVHVARGSNGGPYGDLWLELAKPIYCGHGFVLAARDWREPPRAVRGAS